MHINKASYWLGIIIFMEFSGQRNVGQVPVNPSHSLEVNHSLVVTMNANNLEQLAVSEPTRESQYLRFTVFIASTRKFYL